MSKTNPGKISGAVKGVAVGKEKPKAPLNSWEDIEVTQNKRGKKKIHLKTSSSCDLTVAYVTFTK